MGFYKINVINSFNTVRESVTQITSTFVSKDPEVRYALICFTAEAIRESRLLQPQNVSGRSRRGGRVYWRGVPGMSADTYVAPAEAAAHLADYEHK